MTDEQLREAVARAMWERYAPHIPWSDTENKAIRGVWCLHADAAIARMRPVIRAQALEEAALELEKWGDIYGDNAAAAIRALIPSDAEPSQKVG